MCEVFSHTSDFGAESVMANVRNIRPSAFEGHMNLVASHSFPITGAIVDLHHSLSAAAKNELTASGHIGQCVGHCH